MGVRSFEELQARIAQSGVQFPTSGGFTSDLLAAYFRTWNVGAPQPFPRGFQHLMPEADPSLVRAQSLLIQTFRARRLPQPRDVVQFVTGASGESVSHVDGAPPRQNFQALQTAQQGGYDPRLVADAFVGSRLLTSLRESTVESYLSALRIVFLFCHILHCDMIPASRQSIWRFAALISNASSLKVYLAAWRKAHILSGFYWPCEACPILRDIRKGVANMMAVRGLRPRIRARRLIALVYVAVRRGAWATACRYALSYQYLLRVPSELLAQFTISLLHVDPSTGFTALGPLRRKTSRSETLYAPCICNSNGAFVCAHKWATWALRKFETTPTALVLATPYGAFLRELRADLVAIGVPAEEAQRVGSHAFRHGAAKDLLEEAGLQTAMVRGGWRSAGIFHYTPRSEVEAHTMAEVWENLSDDEP